MTRRVQRMHTTNTCQMITYVNTFEQPLLIKCYPIYVDYIHQIKTSIEGAVVILKWLPL